MTMKRAPFLRSVLVHLLAATPVAVLGACSADTGGTPIENIDSVEPALGSFNVLTRNYDNQRTGANLSETILNQSNVNASQFGKLFEVQLDDQAYAQPLYASAVTIAGGVHNVIYAATLNNTVYAFDADTQSAPLWKRNF